MIRQTAEMWFLIGLTAIALIMFGQWVNTPPDDGVITHTDVYDMAWSDACRVTRYNCGNVARPTVMYQDLSWASGSYYCGRDVVLDVEQNPVTDGSAYAVLVHEFVHFIQIYHYGVRCPFPGGGQKCLYEFEAWTAQQDIKEELGIERATLEEFNSSYHCTNIMG